MLTTGRCGKTVYYRKDGNKLGRRKEKEIMIEKLERSLRKHEINSCAGRMGKRINCCVVGAGAMATMSLHASIGSMGMVHGIPHNPMKKMKDDPKRINMFYGGNVPNTIMVDGVPHNPMDEFDWTINDSLLAQYIDFQFKARKKAYKVESNLTDGDHSTYKPLEGVMLKPNKAEDCFGYNKELHEFFKANPPIPIEDTKKYEVSEQDGMTKVKLGNVLKGGIRLFNKDAHGNLVRLTKEIHEELQNSYPEDINTHNISISKKYMFDTRLTEEAKRDIQNSYPENINPFNILPLPSNVAGKPIDWLLTNLALLNNGGEADQDFINIWTRRPIISLDLDDVIYDLMKKNIQFIEEVYGVKDVHLEITDYYYLYNNYPRIAEELWNHPENYITSELIDGALEFYKELVELVGEDRIQIVTSSMENVIPLKDIMIKERFGINCKIIHSIFGKFKKHHFTKNTFLIEDCVGNVRDHYMHNQNHGIIFNHMNLEYIKKECDAEGFTHTTTYGELIEYVKRYLSSIGII